MDDSQPPLTEQNGHPPGHKFLVLLIKDTERRIEQINSVMQAIDAGWDAESFPEDAKRLSLDLVRRSLVDIAAGLSEITQH